MIGWRYEKRHEVLRAHGTRQVNRFAELMAEGYTIAAAARVMGVHRSRGGQLLKRICEELGEQAV